MSKTQPRGSKPADTRRRRWGFRAAAVGLLLLAPVALEAALRLFGVGESTSFLVRKGDYWYPNEKFAEQFFGPKGTSRPVYFRVPLEKGTNVLRICVLGESAAMGTPDPAFSFGRILEVMLESNFRRKKIELVNAAMRGIDSHVIRQIARDCRRLKPDVVIVYMGNNEVIGLHGPEPGCSRWSQTLWVMRAGQWLKGTRIGQVVRRSEVGGRRSEGRGQDMEFFRKHRLAPDDWRREAVRRNFAANLEDVCQSAPRVIVSTVPVNVKDFPPLGSVGPPWDANAEFRLGQKFLAAGDTNQARMHFERALDWDALQFRADGKLNGKIREVAGQGGGRYDDGVTLVDSVTDFCDADGGIPGAKLFRDHVHPTFEGDYLLARQLLHAVVQRFVITPTVTMPSLRNCAQALGYAEWHDAQIQLAMADLTSRPPYHDQLDYRERQAAAESAARQRLAKLTVPEVEAGLETVRAALKRRPDDWMLHYNCAQLYQVLGRAAEAVPHLEAITKMFPEAESFQQMLAQAKAAASKRRAGM